jgi:glycosyl transferase/beta-hydroxylase protein BlmF
MNGISLLVATRERPANINRFWSSFVSTRTLSYEQLQVIFLVDNDDSVTCQFLNSLFNNAVDDVKQFNSLHIIKENRNNIPMRINSALSSVKHDIVGLFGDDIIFRTRGWDSQVVDAFKEWPDKIGVVYGSDGWQNEKLCTHPFLSRRWIETVGYIAYDGFFHYCVDTWTHDIAKRIGRLKYLPNVLFEHMHPDAKKAHVDNTRRSRVRFFQHDIDVYNSGKNERLQTAQKLARSLT